MDPEILKVALAVAALTAGLVIVLLVLRGKGRKRAARLGPAFELGTSGPVGILDSAVGGMYRGYSCRYLIQYPSQYDRGGANLRLQITSPNQWSAEVGNPGSRLLTRIGLLRDFDIGDRELDEHLRFAADEESSLRSLFGAEAVRDAMHVLAAGENFQTVRVRNDRVDVRWSPRVATTDEDPDVLRFRLEQVTALVTACGYPPAHPVASIQ